MPHQDSFSDRRVLLGLGALAAAGGLSTAAQAQPAGAHTAVFATCAAAMQASLAGVQQVLVLSYDDKSLPAPSIYQHAGGEPKHSAKFKASDGSWWELSETSVSLAAFGARGDHQDDTAALENAFAYLTQKGGGELFVPPGFFVFTRDVRLLGNNVTIRGTGPASVLQGKNNARLILGR